MLVWIATAGVSSGGSDHAANEIKNEREKKLLFSLLQADGGIEKRPGTPSPSFRCFSASWRIIRIPLVRQVVSMMSEFNSIQCTPSLVLQVAQDVFESRQIALGWLENPVPALGGKIPSELIQSPDGCKDVLQVFKKLKNGDFS